MDNICHTLVGAALAESGLKRRTALGTATLLIGANLPDVDGFMYFKSSIAALGFRRGLTHGIPAMLVWPFILTGLMLLMDAARLRWSRVARAPADSRGLLLLSAIAVWSHPILDTLNTYGVRWLSPFSSRWFYADTLFIADPWLWAALALGLIVARWRERHGQSPQRSQRPARLALWLSAGYIVVMAASTLVARVLVRRELVAQHHEGVQALMVAPVPVNPFRRTVVVAAGGHDLFGRFEWLPTPRLEITDSSTTEESVPHDQRVASAAATMDGRIFLSWARFPLFLVTRGSVYIIDARYRRDPGTGFGVVAIPTRGLE